MSKLSWTPAAQVFVFVFFVFVFVFVFVVVVVFVCVRICICMCMCICIRVHISMTFICSCVRMPAYLYMPIITSNNDIVHRYIYVYGVANVGGVNEWGRARSDENGNWYVGGSDVAGSF